VKKWTEKRYAGRHYKKTLKERDTRNIQEQDGVSRHRIK
jgi:hypothetical protein